MIDEDEPTDDAIILTADQSLLRKLGKTDLDKVFSPEVIKKAEVIIADASDVFYVDCIKEAGQLQSTVERLSRGPGAEENMKKTISISFAIKTKAGQSGYDLVSLLAKSLHLRCEEMSVEQLTPAALKIIAWHAQSIKQLLVLNVKGNGGAAGEAILAELEKLKVGA